MLRDDGGISWKPLQPQTTGWTYDISASTEVGRQKHDIVALGYMLDLLRRFAGPRWTPPRAEVI